MTEPAHVLVVDDDPDLLSALAITLRAHRYVVHTARSGSAGLELAGRHPPDIAVVDLGLPDMDGVEVCREMRQSTGVPIVVLSARGAEGDKVAALDAGADDYVTKPFATEEFLARIRAALRRVDTGSPSSEAIVRGALVIDRERAHRALHEISEIAEPDSEDI